MKMARGMRGKMKKAAALSMAAIMMMGLGVVNVSADEVLDASQAEEVESSVEETESVAEETDSAAEEVESTEETEATEETSEEVEAVTEENENGEEAKEGEDSKDEEVTDPTIGSISLAIGADETQRNLTWYSETNEEGKVLVAKNSDLVDGEMPEGAESFTATVKEAKNKSGYYTYKTTVTGLESDTTYAYQLYSGETKSAVYSFTTGSDGSFSFAVAGDPQLGASRKGLASDTAGWEETLQLFSSSSELSGVDFMLSLGDQVNNYGGDENEYDAYLDHDALQGLTVATLVGNHDNGCATAYNDHYNITNESKLGETTTTNKETNETTVNEGTGDYYFVYNHVLFMALNSNNMSTAEHKQFMEEAIAATADQDITWKVATFHHSIYSVASHANDGDILERRQELAPVFKELDIDVVLMGHDHVYCRTYMMDGLTPMTDTSIYDDDNYSSITNPEGVLYVTMNSASGSKFYTLKNQTFDYSAVLNQENRRNISRVDVSDSQFTVTTYNCDDMSVVDTFTINRDRTYTSVAGDDRYETSTAAAETAYPNGAETVVLVKGNDFPDALSANSYAGVLNAPVLMNNSDKLNDNVKELLTSDAWKDTVKKIVIIGDGMDSSVVKELRALGLSVVKIAGKNRYETAAKVAKATTRKQSTDTVIVATGLKAADAISASSWSYSTGYPILLANADGQLDETSKEFIEDYASNGIEHVILLGAESVVSDDCACGLDFVRLGGKDRYETSQKIAEYFSDNGYGSIENCVAFADGTDAHYPDALVAGQVMAQQGSGIILTNGSKEEVMSYISDNYAGFKGNTGSYYFFGWVAEGKSAEYDTIVSAIESQDEIVEEA